MLYHNQHGPICTTRTGRLIQVTVCELERDFKLWAQPETTSQRATPTGPRWDKGTGCTRHDTVVITTTTRTTRLGLKPRGPPLAPGGLTSYGLISLPGPSPHI